MKKVLGSTKFKAIVIPTIILLIFGFLLVLTILKQEQRLPSKGWSRGIDLNSEIAPNSYPLIQKDNGNYNIYTKTANTINEITLNSNLDTVNKNVIPVKISSYSQFWTDGKQIVFVKNHQLVKVENGKTTVLDQNVDGLTSTENDVFYWKSNLIYKLEPTSSQVKQLSKVPYPIDTVVAKAGSANLLVKSDVINAKNFYLGELSNSDGYRYHALDSIDQPFNATDGDFDFVTNDGIMYVVYDQFGSTVSGMYRRNFLETFNIKTYQKQKSTDELSITNGVTGLTLNEPTHIKVNWINGGLALLFEEQSTLFRGEEARNIYLANYSGKSWVAKPVSATAEQSTFPEWLSSNTILWSEVNGKSQTLMLGSQNPTIIQKSEHIFRKDWANAVSTALVNLSISFLMLAYALLWLIPTGIFYVVMYIGNMTLMERNPYWVKVVGVGLFIITQIIFTRGLFNPTFALYSPSYLQFPGNFIIIPLVLAGISWGIAEWVKNEEWGNNLFIFYCLLIDVLMLGFLIGPYTM